MLNEALVGRSAAARTATGAAPPTPIHLQNSPRRLIIAFTQSPVQRERERERERGGPPY